MNVEIFSQRSKVIAWIYEQIECKIIVMWIEEFN